MARLPGSIFRVKGYKGCHGRIHIVVPPWVLVVVAVAVIIIGVVGWDDGLNGTVGQYPIGGVLGRARWFRGDTFLVFERDTPDQSCAPTIISIIAIRKGSPQGIVWSGELVHHVRLISNLLLTHTVQVTTSPPFPHGYSIRIQVPRIATHHNFRLCIIIVIVQGRRQQQFCYQSLEALKQARRRRRRMDRRVRRILCLSCSTVTTTTGTTSFTIR
mmetsp:Transcript_14132/g.25599  ORF Transcript_14132/g.25599 Transcript_14132/m.25599 type:complete len:215 (+) Transcript_14132:1850-2494(+)